MYLLNDAKVFLDTVDSQTVALMVDTGYYYTFNAPASAVLLDLAAGYRPDEVFCALEGVAEGGFERAELDRLIERILLAGVLEEAPAGVAAGRPEMVCEQLTPTRTLTLEMESFDDMVAYFEVDPIHEASPEMGWPHAKECD